MGLKFVEEHEITYYECDLFQNLTIPMLINIMIKVSESQTNQLTDPKELYNQGLGWIITQYELKINKLPKQGDLVYVTTEAMEYNKYFCYRHFWMHDQHGNLLAELEAVFSLMDLEKRKITNVTDEIISPYKSTKTTKLRRYAKITPPEEVMQSKDYQVRFFDLDGNGHVNNSHYFDWMLDVLEMDFLAVNQPAEIDIKYDREVAYGETITSSVEVLETSAGLMTNHLISNEAAENCAVATIRWQNRG